MFRIAPLCYDCPHVWGDGVYVIARRSDFDLGGWHEID